MAVQQLNEAIYNKDINIVRSILNNKTLDFEDDVVYPLLLAIEVGYQPVINLLLSHPNINIYYEIMETAQNPMERCCRFNNFVTAERLLMMGFDPNYKDYYNCSLTHNAIRNNNIPFVELLVRYGATIDFNDILYYVRSNEPNDQHFEYLILNSLPDGEVMEKLVKFIVIASYLTLFNILDRHYHIMVKIVSQTIDLEELIEFGMFEMLERLLLFGLPITIDLLKYVIPTYANRDEESSLLMASLLLDYLQPDVDNLLPIINLAKDHGYDKLVKMLENYQPLPIIKGAII